MVGKSIDEHIDRRSVLRTVGGAGVAFGLAGCTGISDSTGSSGGGGSGSTGGGSTDGGATNNGSTGGTTNNSSTGGGSEKQPIDVGVSVPLSGSFSSTGTLYPPAIKAWGKMIREQGGIDGHTINIEIVDNESSETRSSRIASQFVTDNKDFIVSAYSSPMMRAAAPAANKAGIPIFNPTGVNYEMHSEFEYAFQFQPTLSQVNTATLLESTPVEKVAAWGVDLDWTTQSMTKFAEEVAPKHGLDVVFTDVHSDDQRDFSSLVLKAQQQSAKALVTFNYPPHVIAQMRAVNNSNWEPTFVSSVTAGVEDVYNALGPKLINHTSVPVVWSESVDFPGNKDFIKRFKEEAPQNVAIAEHPAMGWGALQNFGAAVNALGNDAKDGSRLQQWFLNNTAQTILGPSRFDSDGIQQGYHWKETQWQGKKTPLVAPKDVAQTDLVYPKTWP